MGEEELRLAMLDTCRSRIIGLWVFHLLFPLLSFVFLNFRNFLQRKVFFVFLRFKKVFQLSNCPTYFTRIGQDMEFKVGPLARKEESFSWSTKEPKHSSKLPTVLEVGQ